MDYVKADETTRLEVDILIFDYLLCIAIFQAINTDKSDSYWLDDTLRMLRSILPQPEFLSSDIQAKIRLFDIISILVQAEPMAQSELVVLADALVSICDAAGKKATKGHATELANQLRLKECTLTALSESITTIMRSLEAPILIQLERGKMDGLSCDETQQLKKSVGLS